MPAIKKGSDMSVLTQVADRISGGRFTKRDFDTRLQRFTQTGGVEDGDSRALVDAFLKSGGEWLTDGSRSIAARTPKYDFSDADDVLGLWRRPGSLETTLGLLRRDGYAILDVELPAETVASLSRDFSDAPCSLTSDKKVEIGPNDRVQVDIANPLAEKYAVDTNALVQNPTVRQLVLDRGLLQIAQEYIGSAPIIDIITAWYSFPTATPSHEAAQLFHFDLDRVRWLKVFFLLTDQTLETGAHTYIPGTQRDGGIDPRLLGRGYARLEDDDVAAFHPQSTWKTMEGTKGQILLEDTRGLHKGRALKHDYRLMLQFEYTQSLFGDPPLLQRAHLDPIEDDHWQSMSRAFPLTTSALSR